MLSQAWLDLSREPIVLSVPDLDHRYYMMPMLSGWTDVFASPGKRTTGTKEQTMAVVGPAWSGKLPEGVRLIRAPTATGWVVGRTQTDGNFELADVPQGRQYVIVAVNKRGQEHRIWMSPAGDTVDLGTVKFEAVRVKK